MEKEKMGNPNDRTRLPETDSNQGEKGQAYYKDLYNDLPGEVVEILMQTHPLMGKKDADPESTAYRKKRNTLSDDVEAVKQERMKLVGEEIQKEKEEIAFYPPKRGKKEEEELHQEKELPQKNKEHKISPAQNTMNYDEEDDRVQYVKMKVDVKRKAKQMDEQEPIQKKRKTKKVTEHKQFGHSEDMEFRQRVKEENLNCLYDDEEYEEERFELDGNKKKMLLILGVVVLLVGGLLIKCVSLSGKLAKAQEQIEAFNDMSSKYEELQIEKLTLDDQVLAWQNGESYKDYEASTRIAAEEKKTTEKNSGENASKSDGKFEIYTTKPNDTYWDISQSYYGNGAYYTRILEANGLKESDTIREGQKLKIPKQ